jgi:hypothetical protein
MTTLTEFLLARIAEDEAAAQAATPGPWNAGAQYADAALWVGDDHSEGIAHASWEYDESSAANFEHIARHDPARVLAECETKRRIVEAHPLTTDVFPVWTGRTPGVACETCGGNGPGEPAEDIGPCDTLLAIVLPYADHPDYRNEWKP